MCLKKSVKVLQISTLISHKNEYILTYFFNYFFFIKTYKILFAKKAHFISVLLMYSINTRQTVYISFISVQLNYLLVYIVILFLILCNDLYSLVLYQKYLLFCLCSYMIHFQLHHFVKLYHSNLYFSLNRT